MTKKIILFGFVAVLSLSFISCAALTGVKTPESLKGFNFTTREQLLAMEEYPQFYFESGPVQHLITQTEKKIWKQIKVEAEKEIENIEQKKELTKIEKESLIRRVEEKRFQNQKDFLEHFWKIRDPSPSTPINEFKERFYLNVTYAQKYFTQEYLGRGWNSDRGRILLLFGSPDWAGTISNVFSQRYLEEEEEKNMPWPFWGDQTAEIIFWEYQKLEYIPAGFLYFQFNFLRRIYFRRGSINGWEQIVPAFGEESFSPTRFCSEYVTSLEKIFEFLRNAYIFNKQMKFSIPK